MYLGISQTTLHRLRSIGGIPAFQVPSRTKTPRHKGTEKQGWSFFPDGGKSHGLIAIPSPRLIERGNATVRDVRSAITT